MQRITHLIKKRVEDLSSDEDSFSYSICSSASSDEDLLSCSMSSSPGFKPTGEIQLDKNNSWVVMPPEIPLTKIVQEKFLEKGCFGEVYKVTLESKEKIKKMVAVKKNFSCSSVCFSEKEKEIKKIKKIIKEVIIMFSASFGGSNIVRLYGMLVDENEKPSGLVMEYMQGGNLFDYLDDNNSLSEEEYIEWALDIVKAVKSIHANGYLHRDLKLENILITEKNNKRILKITDFGLSSEKKASQKKVSPGIKPIGSMPYLAPELLKSYQASLKNCLINCQYEYSEFTDIYSVGVILYEMLIGGCFDDALLSKKNNVNESNEEEIFRESICKGEKPEIINFRNYSPEVFNTLKGLIEKCWSGTPSERPTIEKIIDKLNKLKKDIKQSELKSPKNLGVFGCSRLIKSNIVGKKECPDFLTKSCHM